MVIESCTLPSCNFVTAHSLCCEEQLLSPCHLPVEELTRKYNLFCHYSGGKKNHNKKTPKAKVFRPSTSGKLRVFRRTQDGDRAPTHLFGKLRWDEHPGKVGSILQMPCLCLP